MFPLLEHAAVGRILEPDHQGVPLLPGRGGKLEGGSHPPLPLVHVFKKSVPVLADLPLGETPGRWNYGRSFRLEPAALLLRR